METPGVDTRDLLYNFIFLTLRLWVFQPGRHLLIKWWDLTNFHVLYKVLRARSQPLFSADSHGLQYVVADTFPLRISLYVTQGVVFPVTMAVMSSPTRPPDQRLIGGGSVSMEQYGTFELFNDVRRAGKPTHTRRLPHSCRAEYVQRVGGS